MSVSYGYHFAWGLVDIVIGAFHSLSKYVSDNLSIKKKEERERVFSFLSFFLRFSLLFSHIKDNIQSDEIIRQIFQRDFSERND